MGCSACCFLSTGGLEAELAFRRLYTGHYGAADHYAHDGGSTQECPRFFPGRQLWLGSGRLRTVFKIVLPSAIPGILAGVILAIGRIVGESAALIYTAGTVAEVPSSLLDSARTLSVHMYALSSEGLYINQTYATAVVLLVIVIGINALSAFLAKKISKKSAD